MNKALPLVLALVGLTTVTSALRANDLVNIPVGPAGWVVVISDSKSHYGDAPAPKPGPRPTRVEVTQDSQQRRSVITTSDGKTVERWEIPKLGLILAEQSDGRAMAALNAGIVKDVLTVPFSNSAFDWIAAQYLIEPDPISYQGKMCFHYRGPVHLLYYGSGTPPPPTTFEAWIDSKTLLPVALDTGSALGTFTFQKEPPPPLTLPAKFQAKLDRWQMGMGVVKP